MPVDNSKTEYMRKYRRKNRLKIRKYNKEYNKKWRKIHGYSNEKDPKKKFARDLINDLLRRGDIEREPCEVCGKKKTQAHHKDYNRPWLILWLCKKHHKILHEKSKQKNNGK